MPSPMPPPISRPCTTWTAALPLHSHRLDPRTAGYVGCSHGAYADDDRVRLADRDRSLFLKLSCAWQPGS